MCQRCGDREGFGAEKGTYWGSGIRNLEKLQIPPRESQEDKAQQKAFQAGGPDQRREGAGESFPWSSARKINSCLPPEKSKPLTCSQIVIGDEQSISSFRRKASKHNSRNPKRT